MKRRSGFTLIELLVVIAIIAILIGLLVPAVQKVRDAANRTQCENNLKQIGVAMHNYHSDHNMLPSGSNPLGYTALAILLPYVEQQSVFNQVNFSVSATSALNAGPTAQTIPTFVCPADPMTTIPAGWGGNNYYANYGVNPPFFQNSTIADGVFALREAVGRKITDILDGSSNTAAFSEMGKGDFNNAKYTITDWLNACAAGMPTTPDQANTICNSIDPTNLSYQWRSPGGEWLNDSNSGIAYYHIRLPNTWTCAWPCNLSAAMTANSYHGGGSNNSGGAGVNVVLCDGSVRFITNGISMATWRAVGTRAGEEILGGDY